MMIDDYEKQVALWRSSMTAHEREQFVLEAAAAEAAFIADQEAMTPEMVAEARKSHEAFMDIVEEIMTTQFRQPTLVEVFPEKVTTNDANDVRYPS